MELTLNEVKQVIETLPSEDRKEIRNWLNEEENAERGKDERQRKHLERYKKARRWLNENSEKYMNQWVCLEGDKLIAHGTDGLEVHRKAKETGIASPFLHHIVDESLPFGGW